MKKIISVLLLMFSLFSYPGYAESENVEMFRGSSELTGVYNSKAVSSLEKLSFVFQTNGAVRSSPVISGGILYIGSNDGNFYALNDKSGEELWKFETKGPVTSTAAVYDNTVWFTSRDNYLYALQAKDGKELWKFKMGGDLIIKIIRITGISIYLLQIFITGIFM